jgi:hypothetical protein
MGEKFQKQVYNKSVDNVKKTNKELIELYKEAQKNIEKKIAVLKMQIEKGLFAEARTARLKRLQGFLDSIKEDIITLKTRERLLIAEGFVENYKNGYYGYAYDITKTINTEILNTVGFDYTLGYRKLNASYIERVIFSNEVAQDVFGLGIKDRLEQDVLQLQSQIRKQVTQALVEGISPRQLANRLAGVDDVYQKNLNHAFTVARTEMLRGHNMGSQEAIDTAEDAGVQGNEIWDATLDGFTRPTHRKMDTDSRKGLQPNKEGFFVFPDGSRGRYPLDPTLSAKESVNCRCAKLYLPFGVSPNRRGARLANGEWILVNGDLSYEDWANTLEGKKSIEAADEYRRKRAKRLSELRAKKKKRPVIENVKKRLEGLNKA